MPRGGPVCQRIVPRGLVPAQLVVRLAVSCQLAACWQGGLTWPDGPGNPPGVLMRVLIVADHRRLAAAVASACVPKAWPST
jgi:hypothetical protein